MSAAGQWILSSPSGPGVPGRPSKIGRQTQDSGQAADCFFASQINLAPRHRNAYKLEASPIHLQERELPYDYWILGRSAGAREPRWSVIRNVLHLVN